MKFFHPKSPMRFINNITVRTTRTFYYVIKAKLYLNFAKQSATHLIKQHREIFPTQNVMEMKETIQYHRNPISDDNGVM